jgi:hypothetical protein
VSKKVLLSGADVSASAKQCGGNSGTNRSEESSGNSSDNSSGKSHNGDGSRGGGRSGGNRGSGHSDGSVGGSGGGNEDSGESDCDDYDDDNGGNTSDGDDDWEARKEATIDLYTKEKMACIQICMTSADEDALEAATSRGKEVGALLTQMNEMSKESFLEWEKGTKTRDGVTRNQKELDNKRQELTDLLAAGDRNESLYFEPFFLKTKGKLELEIAAMLRRDSVVSDERDARYLAVAKERAMAELKSSIIKATKEAKQEAAEAMEKAIEAAGVANALESAAIKLDDNTGGGGDEAAAVTNAKRVLAQFKQQSCKCNGQVVVLWEWRLRVCFHFMLHFFLGIWYVSSSYQEYQDRLR